MYIDMQSKIAIYAELAASSHITQKRHVPARLREQHTRNQTHCHLMCMLRSTLFRPSTAIPAEAAFYHRFLPRQLLQVAGDTIETLPSPTLRSPSFENSPSPAANNSSPKPLASPAAVNSSSPGPLTSLAGEQHQSQPLGISGSKPQQPTALTNTQWE
jgi:hypothetical protein